MTRQHRSYYTAALPWVAWLWLLFVSDAVAADPRIPMFNARYDVKLNGIRVAKAEFSLSSRGGNEFVYSQSSRSTGLAALFGSQSVDESSRWELTPQGIRPIRYRYEREGGDDDDDRHVELIFDWSSHRVENRVQGQPWSMAIPDGTLDKLLVQVAMLMDLRSGEREFTYPVADGGRLKHYAFAVVGEETIELPDGDHHTIKIQRTDDDRDQTYIWAAPDLQYMPVRFMKLKKSGLKYEMRLREFSRNTEI
jgi:hypothetical protein